MKTVSIFAVCCAALVAGMAIERLSNPVGRYAIVNLKIFDNDSPVIFRVDTTTGQAWDLVRLPSRSVSKDLPFFQFWTPIPEKYTP